MQSEVLQYSLYNEYLRFCSYVNGDCPFGPTNDSFEFSLNISDTYQAVSIDTTFYIIAPTEDAQEIGCVSIEATPILASYIWNTLQFSIFGIFIFSLLVYVLCGVFNPWTGTKSIYLMTSNYGNDVNAIRLITPGTCDFIKHLQFYYFMGSVNLNYPGFFRPILATVAWSSLLLPKSLVTHSPGSLVDGLYAVHGSFGMSKLGRVARMPTDEDIWPSFIVWLIAIVAGIMISSLFAVGADYMLKKFNHERFRSVAFLAGNFIRLIFNLFALPLLTYSFFQIFIISRKESPVVADVFSVIVLIGWMVGAGWLTFKIVTVYPKSDLFDDLSKLLTYGTLYNTYVEHKVNFFVIELLLALFRGLTFGAIQDSGLAQITLLAAIELAYLISLISFRPFHSATNMNLISAISSLIRFSEIFLLIPFVGSLQVSATARGWIGYTILLTNCVVIILYFFHVVQTFIELLIRMSGAGSNSIDRTSMAYGLKPLSHGNESNLDMRHDPGTPTPLLPKHLDAVTLKQSGFRIPDNSGNAVSGGSNRDSIFEEVFVTSPTSEINSAVSGNSRGQADYYRRPRRRHGSYDWAYKAPNAKMTRDRASVEEEELAESENDYLYGKKGVDYAVREADVYFTKKGYRGFDEDYEYDDDDEYKGTAITSGGSTMRGQSIEVQPDSHRTVATTTITTTTSTLAGSVRGFVNMFKQGLSRNNQEEPTEESKGFEVLRRQPIRPHNAPLPANSESPKIIDEEERYSNNGRDLVNDDTSKNKTNSPLLHYRSESIDQISEQEFIFPSSQPDHMARKGLRISTDVHANDLKK